MIWRSHALLGRAAAAALPEWEKKLLSFPAAGPELSQLPECRDALDQMAASCLMMDWVYLKEFHRYGLQGNGMQLTHMLPDSEGRGAFFSGNAPDPGKFAEILTFLMTQTLTAWQQQNKLEFLRYAGILGHYLQDVTAPTHTISAKMLRQLFPEPVPGSFTPFGKYVYRIAGDLAIPPPGRSYPSIDQAVFFLTQRAFAAAECARKRIPQLMAAVYQHDEAVCTELLRGPAADAAALTRDAWHTLFCLAESRLEPFSEKLSLTEMAPLYHHPDPYAYIGNDCFYLKSSIVPMKILGGGTGHGFGMTGYSGMKFFLNGVFDRLEFTLGMADDPSSFDEHIQVRFTVESSPAWNSRFSEDMEYGGNVLHEEIIGPGAKLRKIAVPLPDAGTLIFAAKAVPYVNNEGKEVFAVPHLAILDPVVYFKKNM